MSDRNKRRLVYVFPTAAMVIPAALWLPSRWQPAVNGQGQRVGAPPSDTHIGLGGLRPLRLTWESSPNGFERRPSTA